MVPAWELDEQVGGRVLATSNVFKWIHVGSGRVDAPLLQLTHCLCVRLRAVFAARLVLCVFCVFVVLIVVHFFDVSVVFLYCLIV